MAKGTGRTAKNAKYAKETDRRYADATGSREQWLGESLCEWPNHKTLPKLYLFFTKKRFPKTVF